MSYCNKCAATNNGKWMPYDSDGDASTAEGCGIQWAAALGYNSISDCIKNSSNLPTTKVNRLKNCSSHGDYGKKCEGKDDSCGYPQNSCLFPMGKPVEKYDYSSVPSQYLTLNRTWSQQKPYSL